MYGRTQPQSIRNLNSRPNYHINMGLEELAASRAGLDFTMAMKAELSKDGHGKATPEGPTKFGHNNMVPEKP